jgi:hypothetical protein
VPELLLELTKSVAAIEIGNLLTFQNIFTVERLREYLPGARIPALKHFFFDLGQGILKGDLIVPLTSCFLRDKKHVETFQNIFNWSD